MNAIPSAPNAFRADIEALRGIAVLSVVVFHTFPALLPGGFRGVDIFFVISGFLITRIITRDLESGSFSFRRFWMRRVRRILPMVGVVIAAALILGWVLMYPDELARLGSHAGYGALFILNFALIGEVGYFDVEAHYKPLLHLWSLSVEEQFYLVWPVLLWIGYRVTRRPVVAVIAIGAASLVAFLWWGQSSPDAAFYSTLTRGWQLAAGAALAMFGDPARIPNKARVPTNALKIVGTLTIVLSFLLPADTHWIGVGSCLAVIGACLFIRSGDRVSTRWFGLRWFGRISFSLYLWHWVLIAFATLYTGGQPPAWLLIAMVGMSTLLSVASYHWVESLRVTRGWKVPMAVAAALPALVIAGGIMTRSEGFPKRPQILALSDHETAFVKTESVDEACEAWVSRHLEQGERLFAYCRADLHIPERPILVVLGDSHGLAAFTGISDLADRNGLNTIALSSSSCPPLPGYLWDHPVSTKDACTEQIAQRYALIAADPRVNHVMLVTRGPIYWYDNPSRPFTDETLSASEASGSEVDGPRAMEKGYRRAVGILARMENIDNIFLLVENPELDFLPRETLPRPFDRYGLALKRNGVSRDIFERRIAPYRNLLQDVAKDEPEATVLDATDLFCGDEQCRIFANGGYLYEDDDHLSEHGSRQQAKYLSDMITPRIAKRD